MSTVVACCGTDAGSASARSAERPGLGRSKESGAVIWSRSVSGFPPIDPSAPLGATLAEHRAVGRKTQPAGGRPLLQSCSTTLCDDAGRRLAAPHTKFPNCDTEPSLDSLPG